MTSILDTVFNTRRLKILGTAVKITDLGKTLNSKRDFTIFAPIDRAFSELPKDTLPRLSQDILLLAKILSVHIVPRKLTYQDLLNICCVQGNVKITLTTIDGSLLDIDLSDGIKVGNSTVLSTNVSADNGIIYEIDRVLMPK
jgi:uncharacterized surface protein with fasciclin (FAS1) repeats